MPSVEQLRSRLLKKLSELFQLDQPDLDFGFYRIMHAKAQEVQDFIGTDLLKIVGDAFGDVDEARKAELQAAYEKSIQTAKDFGAPNPEETEPVKKAKAALDAVKDTVSAEADVYDHLYRFFERYYDDGDFISRRYYTRETSGKAAPFAVPYNGEEVKLHWANADQYYIKSSEYFSNFTFDLRQAKEVQALKESMDFGEDKPLRVHFRIVEATEGEHGNVKANEAAKRFFIIHQERPVALNDAGELIVDFEYRPDPEKSGQEGTWRDKRNAEAVAAILDGLQDLGKENQAFQEYLRLFKVPAPTDSDKKRPVLAKYVNQYTARNTMDYFIHKDLGGFLHRELDFYIKNEVMRLDDLENAEAPTVESYLAKIKVLRKIAGKLVDFLAQLEDFQKKLWLKKKFVIETNYCITLDRIPEELYAEVAACDAQCEEWVKLFAIDEIQADLHSSGFSRPLAFEFLKANNKLVLDTRFFDDSFKARLMASIENFDEQCDGLLINSENFQALNLIKEQYGEQVKCVYIDPPYNTGSGDFLYKDTYRHSSWISSMAQMFLTLNHLIDKSTIIGCSIDDNEIISLGLIMTEIYGESNKLAYAPWKAEPSGGKQKTGVRFGHEYLVIYSNGSKSNISRDETELGDFNFEDENGPYIKGRELRKWGDSSLREDRPGQHFPLLAPDGSKILPYRNDGRAGRWRWGKDNPYIIDARNNPSVFHWEKTPYDDGIEIDGQKERWDPFEKIRETTKQSGWGTWLDEHGTNADGTKVLKCLFGSKSFNTPKPPALIKWFINLSAAVNGFVLDCFAGSGTAGQSTIELNRQDEGVRKFILVEMGDYFDTVLKPRIAKVVYSDSWKDGKPTTRDTGVSHCFKYIRLESYEDTLNNVRFDDDPRRQKAVAANRALKEDYMLRYLLDVETRGSQSLLNIDAFGDPTAYTLEVKKPGTDEYVTRAVDLIETFSYLIGLRVLHTSVPQTFQATFKRITDPELPEDQHTKLVVEGRIRQIEDGPWWIRKIEGWVPKDPANPNNGHREKVLIVWRKLTDDIEKDNLMLDEWFQKNRISTRDFEFDTIYVNGSNNLPNLKQDDENWKVRLIEEEFHKRMWNGEGA